MSPPDWAWRQQAPVRAGDSSREGHLSRLAGVISVGCQTCSCADHAADRRCALPTPLPVEEPRGAEPGQHGR